MEPVKQQFSASATMHIQAPVAAVWAALIDPEMIRKYFFGTNAVSDWKEGSTLHWQGTWEGKPYLDKGYILKRTDEKLLRYSYLSSWSGLPDLPENYATVTYELSPENGGTSLTITQDRISSEEQRKHSEQNWMGILKSLKELLEKK